jgi:hypothetical protein
MPERERCGFLPPSRLNASYSYPSFPCCYDDYHERRANGSRKIFSLLFLSDMSLHVDEDRLEILNQINEDHVSCKKPPFSLDHGLLRLNESGDHS